MPRLFISVCFHDGRYHGRPDWPPSPARLFQALVAGAAQGETLAARDDHALSWLETLEAPVIAAPPMRTGQSLINFVPNNDLDAVGSDPGRVSEIRAPKLIRPVLFEAGSPLLYAWAFDDAPEAQANAQRLSTITKRLYQLGRGVDMAWAWGEILDERESEARLSAHGGALHRPARSPGGTTLAVPLQGTLASLTQRHQKTRARFQRVAAGQVFVQPPKPRFRQVAYESLTTRLMFDLVGETTSWRLDRIVALTEHVRDAAAERLKAALPADCATVHNMIVGRRDAGEADKAARVRIAPLPSIGHRFADHAIRRILVEIPSNCPLRVDDLHWAFSLALLASDDGEVLCELAPSADRGMLAHYGLDDAPPARLWRTVTPAALPQQVARRRIDPARQRTEAKTGTERAREECEASSAVIQALRHAGARARPITIRVQREPFEAKGTRAEAFAPGPRFRKERLWHVEVSFSEQVRGPLIIGDGRYLGLGIMAPVRNAGRDIIAFPVPADARIAMADRQDLLRAVRRALMALSRDSNGAVPRLFSGHEPDGGPAQSGRHDHIFLAAIDADGDKWIDKVIVVAPWVCDRTLQPRQDMRAQFDRIVSSLTEIRAGALGVLRFGSTLPVPADDVLVGPARAWESLTPYRTTRHAGRTDLAAAVRRDAIIECRRRGLPQPAIEVLKVHAGQRGGAITAMLCLDFTVAIEGPIMLGQDSHSGGGLFNITTAKR